jgi:tRNA threonylcarbamoyladenosine biosynthesis protein TsaE
VPSSDDRPARLETRRPEETRSLGAALGRAAFPGSVLLLEGPLGVGKTVLARGVADGLDVRPRVTSPSFGILSAYDGRLPLYHLDLYRVNEPGELRALDLAEIFDSGGVAVVEWPRWLWLDPPAGALRISIRAAGSARRIFELSSRDPRWRTALAAAQTALPAGVRA